jgi:Tachylectin
MFFGNARCYPAIFTMAALLSAPLHAQAVKRVTTPGAAFVPFRTNIAFVNVPDGRQFRTSNGTHLVLDGPLTMPAAGQGNFQLTKLVVHFHSDPGAFLVAVRIVSGSADLFRVQTRMDRNHSQGETPQPPQAANTWDFSKAPITVSLSTRIRLEVQFPHSMAGDTGGGETAPVVGFTVVGVDAEYPSLVIQQSLPPGDIRTAHAPRIGAGTAATVAVTNIPSLPQSIAVIYALNSNNELYWYRHDGRTDGTPKWADPNGLKVGSDWKFKQVFSGGNGIIYAVTRDGDLLWYRHDGRGDGTFQWASLQGAKVGNGWNFKEIFSVGGGVIYALNSAGDLYWYRHDGYLDGTPRWADPNGRKIASGWYYDHLFAGSSATIYAIDSQRNLLWFRHDGRDDGSPRWASREGKIVATNWNVTHAFSSGSGIIYGVNAANDMLWFRHDSYADGSAQWTAPRGQKVGSGWNFVDVFSGANLQKP